MNIQIDSGIAIPDDNSGRRTVYPLGQMQVLESFFVAGTGRKRNAIMNSASYFGKRHNKKFTCRTVTENGVDGVRVWRIE